MNCKVCGVLLQGNEEYCPVCGANIKSFEDVDPNKIIYYQSDEAKEEEGDDGMTVIIPENYFEANGEDEATQLIPENYEDGIGDDSVTQLITEPAISETRKLKLKENGVFTPVMNHNTMYGGIYAQPGVGNNQNSNPADEIPLSSRGLTGCLIKDNVDLTGQVIQENRGLSGKLMSNNNLNAYPSANNQAYNQTMGGQPMPTQPMPNQQSFGHTMMPNQQLYAVPNQSNDMKKGGNTGLLIGIISAVVVAAAVAVIIILL